MFNFAKKTQETQNRYFKTMALKYHKKLEELSSLDTPFYCYDLTLLRETLSTINKEIKGFPYAVHYAIKANGNRQILEEIMRSGVGADLVSGNEIKAALDVGFKPEKMAYAGVGKTDREIETGIDAGIYCFNVESVEEMDVINEIASRRGKTAGIALRVNPNIDAHTHRYITTGTSSDKFGIDKSILDEVVEKARSLSNVRLLGLHFHIGSQVTLMEPYELLCKEINTLLDHFEKKGINFEMIDVGGGLGVDYDNPEANPIARFEEYFNIFKRGLKARPGQMVHFELGRSIVAQCGALISRVVFVKENAVKKFVILDAGMTDLMRPALYGSNHKIVNLSSHSAQQVTCDVVGPICESSDVFAREVQLPVTRRGDLVAILSAGAYGESMASCYNMRSLPQCHFIE